MKRPLVPVALVYVGGILVACLIPVPPLLLLIVSLSLAALTLAWPRGRLIGLGALIFLTGWTNHTLRTAILSPHDLRRVLGEEPEILTVRGKLRETPTQRVYERNQEESWRTMARIEVTALRRKHQPWQPVAGRLGGDHTGPAFHELLRRAGGRDHRRRRAAKGGDCRRHV